MNREDVINLKLEENAYYWISILGKWHIALYGCVNFFVAGEYSYVNPEDITEIDREKITRKE